MFSHQQQRYHLILITLCLAGLGGLLWIGGLLQHKMAIKVAPSAVAGISYRGAGAAQENLWAQATDMTQMRSVAATSPSASAPDRFYYQETFASTTFKAQTVNSAWNSKEKQVTLALRDQIGQREAVIAANPLHDTIYVVWRDLRNDDGDIYAQLLDSAGNRLWVTDRRVNSDRGAATQFEPAAAVDGDGALWVAWVDNRNGNNDIFLQRMSPSGATLWPDDQPINEDGENADQGGVSLTLLSAQSAVVAWHDNRTGNYDIYVRQISSSGVKGWSGSLRVNSDNTVTAQTYPAIATSANGQIFIAWLDQRVGNSDIYAQRITADGHLVWNSEVHVNRSADAALSRPRVAVNQYDESWVGWIVNPSQQVYAQQLDATGQVMRTSALAVSQSSEPVDSSRPLALLATKDGSFVAAWLRSRDGNHYARRFDRQGYLLWDDEIRLHEHTTDARVVRDGVTLAASRTLPIVASWPDQRNNSDGDIYSQALDLDGAHLWTQDTLVNDQSGKVDQQLAATALSATGESYTIWQDWRRGSPGLYLQRLATDGHALWPHPIQATTVTTATGQLIGDVATLGNDGLVVWSDKRSGAPCIYAQRFDQHGNRQWDNDQLVSQSDDPAVVQLNPTLATDTQGHIYVIWEAIKATSSSLMLQQLNATGSPVWSADLAIPTGEAPRLPTLATAGEDGVVLAWLEIAADEANIYLQRVNTAGQLLWTQKMRGNRTIGEVNAFNPPAVGADNSGNSVITWVDRQATAIMAQRLSPTGEALWNTDVAVNAEAGGFAPLPDLALMPNGNAVIVWQQLYAQHYTIAAQSITPEGAKNWQSSLADSADVIVSLGAQDAQRPKVAVDTAGNSMIVWQERRFKNWDIMAQRLTPAGEVAWPEDSALLPTEKFHFATGSIESTAVDQTENNITSALLSNHSERHGGVVAFALSNDGGVTWESVQPGIQHSFQSTGSDLRWRATLQADPNDLSRAPIIQQILIDYATNQTAGVDPYETDDVCSLARPLQLDGNAQGHRLEPPGAQSTDEDWTLLPIAQTGAYALIAQTTGVEAPLKLSVYSDCRNTLLAETVTNSAGFARLAITATSGSTLYSHVGAAAPAPTQPVPYTLAAATITKPKLAVIAAGHTQGADGTTLTQINQLAARAYRTLLAHGYSAATIYYLNEQAQLDLTGNGANDVDAVTSAAALQYALESWPRTAMTETLQSDALTLLVYLVGQGAAQGFAATAQQTITAPMLDRWLSNLENTTTVDQLAVVVEMNQAGIFKNQSNASRALQLANPGIAGPKRAVVMATHDEGAAWVTHVGALFSDSFWTAFDLGATLVESAERVGAVMNAINYHCQGLERSCQSVWQANGGTAGLWRLYPFVAATAPTVQEVQLHAQRSPAAYSIEAKVLNADATTVVEAHILPPDYTITVPTNGVPPHDTTPVIQLAPLDSTPSANQAQSTVTYHGLYEDFTARGNYKIVLYAWNQGDKAALPVVVALSTDSRLYLPIIAVNQ
ncbi:MAG: hypothetical protein R3C14_33205 [Caldilineaceae bacterium]